MTGFLKKEIAPILYLTLGSVIAAFSLEVFLVPVMILDGGVVGVGMIVSQLTRIPLGILTFVLNLPFLFIGFRQLGRRFLLSAVYSMALFSVMLRVFEDFSGVTSEPILAVVFGGVLLGFGVGLVLRGGGCLDGTETVALLISRRTQLSVGQVVFGINILIYTAAGLLFGWDRAMYSLMTYFVSFKLIDIVEEGMEQAKSVMIIANDGAAMADAIYEQLGRTCTMMEGSGHISGQKSILYCVVTRVEIPAVRRIIKEADGSAFVTISDVSEILGSHIKKQPPPPCPEHIQAHQ